jgi:hypothetical protein
MQTTPRDYALFLSALTRGDVLSASIRDKMLGPQIRIHSTHQFSSSHPSTSEQPSIRPKAIGSCQIA